MSIKLITDESQKEAWDRVVTHPLQTWEWGEVKKTAGNEILRVGIFENEKLVQGFLITLHAIPYTEYKIGNCARSTWPPKVVLQFIQKVLKEKNVIFLKLETDDNKDEAGKYKLPLLLKDWKQENLYFVKSTSHVFAPHTFLVDLHFSEEELLVRMHQKTRYNIRLAEKKGVVVRDVSSEEEGFDIFYSLYLETVKRQNYLGHSYAYHQTVWEKMKTSGAHILVAYYQNKPLSAYELFFYKNTGYYVYGGSSNENKEVMASNLLMWEALKLSKNMGCTWFDMWGALPKNYNPKDPWAGFHRFKEGYGGMHKTYLPTIDLVINPVAYKIFSFIWPIRNWVEETKQRVFGK